MPWSPDHLSAWRPTDYPLDVEGLQLEGAFKDAITIAFLQRDGGSGAARNTSMSGKGGIRTLEGALHPLPA